MALKDCMTEELALVRPKHALLSSLLELVTAHALW